MSQSPFASPEALSYRGTIVPFRVKIVKMFRLVSCLMYIVLRAKFYFTSIRILTQHSEGYSDFPIKDSVAQCLKHHPLVTMSLESFNHRLPPQTV